MLLHHNDKIIFIFWDSHNYHGRIMHVCWLLMTTLFGHIEISMHFRQFANAISHPQAAVSRTLTWSILFVADCRVELVDRLISISLDGIVYFVDLILICCLLFL